MVLSSKPLREYDICNAILLNNEGLSQDLAQLIAMETRDLYEYYGEEYASEIINKVINTKFYVASKQVSKNKPKMESVNEVLKSKGLTNWTILRSNQDGPCLAAVPFTTDKQVTSTNTYVAIPVNYNVDHYDFQGKLLGELSKLATISPYKRKRNKLETRSLLSTITIKEDGTKEESNVELSNVLNEAVVTNIMREGYLDSYSMHNEYNSDSYLIGNEISNNISKDVIMGHEETPSKIVDISEYREAISKPLEEEKGRIKKAA